jgi:hypothetical protein
VPFINLPGLGPKPVTSDILVPTQTATDATATQDLIAGTTLRPGATRLDPGTALDARTLDSSPNQKVDVNGTGRVVVDVKNDPRYTTSQKDEPLAKPVPISKQSQMTPATPTGSESNAEE